KLENKNVELEFQVLNYARENAHLKATYKNLFDSISVSRAQTKTVIASLQNELQSNIYKNAKLRTQLFKKVSDQKDNTQDSCANTKFAKQPIVENPPKIGKTNALSKPVTSNSVSTPQEPKSVKNDKNQKEKVSVKEIQKKYQPKVAKQKKVGTPECLATPKPRKPRFLLRWSPTGKLFNQEGKLVDSSESKSKSNANLYTINPHEMASASPICLMARVSSTKSWLWHQRLSHLNFDSINNLARNDLVAASSKLEAEFTSSSYGFVWTNKNCQYKWKANQVLKEYFDTVGISHQMSSVRTPQQNGVVERRNRTLVEVARTMLIFSRAPLFLWAEVIATACFTQNLSIIHRRFNKTPYELINGKKPDISFLHVFGALCYPKNDREDIGKLGAKGDIGFFIGYSADSCAYRVYNRRTKKIMETMNVSFDELSVMAFKQSSSKPGLNSMTFGHISSGLDLTYAPSTITMQQPSEGELDLLFEAMYDDYFGGQPSATNKHDEEQTVIRNKSRLVVRGYRQEEGIDFKESFAPDSGFELTGFLDADYAGCKDTFKSTSGGAQFLGEKLVSWSSKKQDSRAEGICLGTLPLDRVEVLGGSPLQPPSTKYQRIRRWRYDLTPAESKFKTPMLDHQDKYMMKAQVHVSKSSAISDIQALPRRKHYCQIYQVVKHKLRGRLLAKLSRSRA
nr:retrovirus-related Pol polyprotein from transposon TNT 1-94 [Tanacetum cinerariifolium]